MEKFGKDLHNLWVENNKSFSEKTTYTIGVKIVSM